MSQVIQKVDDLSFEQEVLNSPIPVLVDFWAEWCNPCKMMSIILAEISDLYVGKLKILKLNIDENSIIPSKYEVRGIPMLVLFKHGQVQDTKLGVLSKSQLTMFLDSHL